MLLHAARVLRLTLVEAITLAALTSAFSVVAGAYVTGKVVEAKLGALIGRVDRIEKRTDEAHELATEAHALASRA